MKIFLRLTKKIIYQIIFQFFFLKFFLLVLFKNRIIIFDIDNTVANTWPSLLKKNTNEKERLSNLKPFKNIVKLILSYNKKGEKIIFMSVRNYKFYNITKSWIKNNCLENFNLILISNVYEKLKFLKIFRNKNIIFYDDLSHSHENGVVLFYEDILKELKELNHVKYVGYDKLLVLQKKG